MQSLKCFPVEIRKEREGSLVGISVFSVLKLNIFIQSIIISYQKRELSSLVFEMEVAGFALTVVAFVKTTRSVSHLVKRIHRVAKDAPAIKEQLLQTAIPLKSFVTAVRAAHASLEHKCPDDSDSEVIQYIIRQGLPKDLEQQSFYLEHSIVQVKDRLSTLNSSWGDFITSYRWTKMRPEVEALFAPMESMKTTLSLILNVIILEMKTGECSGKPTAELEAEM